MLSAAMVLTAGSGMALTASAAEENVTIRYGIWDSNQEPTLREIADKFEEENPGITVDAVERLLDNPGDLRYRRQRPGCILDECSAF